MKREIELILNSTHDAMIAVNKKGIITIYNKAAEKLTQFKSEDVLGKKIEDVILTTRLPIILQTGKSELNQKQQLGKIEIITNRMPVKDEKGKIVGAIAVFRDVSEVVKLAEKITDLTEIHEMLEAVFDSTQDAISVVDENGVGLLINPAYTRITGLQEVDVIGKKCTVDFVEGKSAHLKVLKTMKPVKNIRLRLDSGKQAIVQAAPIIVNGELRGSVAVIHDLSEIQKLTEELVQAKKIIRNLEAKYTFDDIIGEDITLKNAKQKARLAAQTPATVLLKGESGTGKELFAHAIHNSSNRKYNQFVRVNCAAINENLLESELFGYEKGAFTGANKDGKIGLFERAHGGTIFLDEIGEISTSTQVKLLRVLQENEIIRVGGVEPIKIDVRVIAATNIDLKKAIEEKKFRKDLYYRINVVPIEMPSLADRLSDIELLVRHLIIKFNQSYGRNIEGITSEALKIMKTYYWPGNVRELENYIGRSIINMSMFEKFIGPNHLPDIEGMQNTKEKQVISKNDKASVSLKEKLHLEEKKYIEEVLLINEGNRQKTASDLDISIRSLYYKLEKYKIY